MQLTKFEKLALWMLSDIAEKVGATDVNPALIKEAVFTGNTWGIEWEYGGMLAEENPDHVVNEVTNILDMWSFIEDAGGPKFPGFDSNREGAHASVARFFTEVMPRSFERFKGRTGHGVVQLDGYLRMLGRFDPIRATLADRHPVQLSETEVEEILAERFHPDNRPAE